MVSILNRYMHAYVTFPVAVSFMEHDIFGRISSSEGDFNVENVGGIVRETHANPGYFNIALRLFESLGWVVKKGERYQVTPNLPNINQFSIELSSNYQIPFERYSVRLNAVDKENKGFNCYLDELNFSTLKKRLKGCQCQVDYLNCPKCLSNSAILLPLIYVLKQTSVAGVQQPSLASVAEKYRTDLAQYLFENGIIIDPESDDFVFSDLGQVLWDSVNNAGVTLSYRPLLENIEQLLFHNARSVFSESETETHVSRALNVIGSGAQHGVFFDSFVSHISDFLTEEILLYSGASAGRRPQLVDMGSGDGTLLKICYERIEADLLKASVGENRIGLVGVDLNEEALEVAAKTLAETPHHLLVGNINDPMRLLSDLDEKGFAKDDLLHIRTFLDHNCPLDDLADIEKLSVSDSDSAYPSLGVYTNEQGDAIPASVIVENLRRNFSRWVKSVGSKGLLTLEVFTLSPATVNKYIEESENLHFDALHGFSNQYLVSADIYLMCAANVGLIPEKSSFRKYPRVLPYSRISQQHFFKKSYCVRHAEVSDLESLYALEDATQAPAIRASRAQIQQRVEQYSCGVYVMLKDDRVVGALYSQRINKESELYQMKFEEVERHHNALGKICQLISVHVDPEEQDGILGQELLSFVILHNFVREGIRKVVGISRCALYRSEKGDYAEYVKGKNKLGYALDPILRLHQGEGANIVDVVPGYREKDHHNLGSGVHISYDYLTWSAKN